MIDDDEPTDPDLARHGVHDTPDVDPSGMPGYEVGFRRGWSLSRSHVLEQFRLFQLAAQVSPADAAHVERRFAEWLRAHGG